MISFLRKFLSILLCFAFLSVQTTFAEALTTGAFAGNDVLNNAKISGHTDGLTGIDKVTNGATLNFNNNTRIDWTNLNVGGSETLNFNNGSYAVLNNVLNGMSTFAGKVTGGTGAIIISNPNGMLLNGGQFETSGSLILTTKNLLNMTVDNLSNQNLIDNINSSNYDNDYSIISLKNNATVKAGTGDINLIAKGIDINQGELVGNNISFSTSNGLSVIIYKFQINQIP